MSLIPQLISRAVVAALIKAGFVVLRQKGSHVFLKNFLTGRVTSVTMHSGTVKKGTLLAIIKQAGLTLKQFKDLLK